MYVKIKKIIFLHGFFASGQCVPALALKEALADNVEVLTPDLPMLPNASFAALESNQFAHCQPAFRDKIWGLFGEQDTLVHYEPLFLQHYNHSFHFPGGHTPTAEEIKLWYVPLINDMLR